MSLKKHTLSNTNDMGVALMTNGCFRPVSLKTERNAPLESRYWYYLIEGCTTSLNSKSISKWLRTTKLLFSNITLSVEKCFLEISLSRDLDSILVLKMIRISKELIWRTRMTNHICRLKIWKKKNTCFTQITFIHHTTGSKRTTNQLVWW